MICILAGYDYGRGINHQYMKCWFSRPGIFRYFTVLVTGSRESGLSEMPIRATGTELTLKNSKSNKFEYVWSITETRKATEKRIRKTLDDWVFCKYATMAILAFSWVRGNNGLLKAILLVVRWLAIWSNLITCWSKYIAAFNNRARMH